MRQKRSIVPERTNIPDAFKRNWTAIEKNDDALTLNARVRPSVGYSMKKLYISFSPEYNGMPAILQVSHPSRLPTWDEIVWIRYQICPDIEDMACILPPIDEYINFTAGRAKYTMTMEDISIRRAMR